MNPQLDLPPLNKKTVGQVVSKTTIAAMVVFGFWLLISNYQIVLIVFLAIFFSIALQPVFGRFTKFGVSRNIAVYGVYASLAISLILFFIFALPQLISQNQVLLESTTGVFADVRQGMIKSGNPLINQLGRSLPENLVDLSELPTLEADPNLDEEAASEEGATVSPTLWLVLSSTIRGVVYLVVVLALSFYWSLDGQRFIQLLLLSAPFERREKIRAIIEEIQNKVGAFVIGQIILCAFIFGLSFILYLSIGLPYAFILALVAGFFEVIPNIGPLLGALPALVVALTHDPVSAVYVLMGTAVMQGIENYLLVPRVMEKTVGVRPFVTILAIVIFGALFGFVGAIVAIPLAVIIEIIINNMVMDESLEEKGNSNRGQASVLRYEAQEIVRDLRKQVREKQMVASDSSDQIEDSLESIAVDLDSILSTFANKDNGNNAEEKTS